MTTSFKTWPAAICFRLGYNAGRRAFHGAVDIILSGNHRFESWEHFLDPKIRQITKTAVIDAEDEHIRDAHQFAVEITPPSTTIRSVSSVKRISECMSPAEIVACNLFDKFAPQPFEYL